ncbi:MAG TPA: hypothetical protein VF883_11785 [Thermoanaerobaculia bacterium]|jgi:hypothetical protein
MVRPVRVWLADLLVGVASAIGLSHFFPGAADDFEPWGETPFGDLFDSQTEGAAAFKQYAEWLAAPMPSRPDIPTSDFLRPIQGLEDLLGFTPRSLAVIAGVSEETLKAWRSDPPPDGEGREKLALLSTFFVSTVPHFEGKPKRAFYEWLATPYQALGGRPLLVVLGEGRLLEAVNFAALWSAREKMRS